MSEAPEPAPSLPTRPGWQRWVSRDELRAAAVIIVGLAVAGVILGVIWQAWSPRTYGFVYQPGAVIPQENENLIASDGRYALLTGIAGLVAGTLAWLWRGTRGPTVAAALAVGGTVGAVVTDVIGRTIAGGHSDGPVNATIKLPITVRAEELLLLEPLAALLVYVLCVMFSSRDDLGRDDPDPTARSPEYAEHIVANPTEAPS